MNKTKVFISTMPFLGQRQLADGTMKDMLETAEYKAIGNPKLNYPEKARFPIIPVINGYAEAVDNIRVIAVLTDGEESNAKNTRYNYEKHFEPEIKAICAAKNLSFNSSEIEKIHTLDSEDMDTQLKLFSDIAGKINPGEEIYACITYGTKPMPIILTLALNYAYKLKKDVSVGCTVYGRYPHLGNGQGTSYIYDTTPLFHMDSIISKLSEINAKDPAKAIRLMLGLEPAEDD